MLKLKNQEVQNRYIYIKLDTFCLVEIKRNNKKTMFLISVKKFRRKSRDVKVYSAI